MNPCPRSYLSNLLETPFNDVIYLLGEVENMQEVAKQDLVALDTKVNCGPIIFEFYSDSNTALDSDLFVVTDPEDIDSETLMFLVLSQEDQNSRGEYLIRYRAQLQEYPDVSVDLA